MTGSQAFQAQRPTTTRRIVQLRAYKGTVMDFADERKGSEGQEKRTHARELFQVHKHLCFIRGFDESWKY
jgi:hypothetical protein